MRIAVVDDSREMLEIIHMCVINNKAGIECECAAFQEPYELLDEVEDGRQYDVYLLDIEMPEINGLKLAKMIRKLQNSAYIVFITSYAEFALLSYDIEIKTYQYILKSEMEEKIPKVLGEISGELEDKREAFYFIQNKRHYEKLKIMEIIYIYKDSKNSVFVMPEGIYKEREALKIVFKDLGRPEFVYIDSGRIINIRYVRRIERDIIYLMNGLELYASHTSIKRLKDKISNYWRNLV